MKELEEVIAFVKENKGKNYRIRAYNKVYVAKLIGYNIPEAKLIFRLPKEVSWCTLYEGTDIVVYNKFDFERYSYYCYSLELIKDGDQV